jgi:hypothetical protein
MFALLMVSTCRHLVITRLRIFYRVQAAIRFSNLSGHDP